MKFTISVLFVLFLFIGCNVLLDTSNHLIGSHTSTKSISDGSHDGNEHFFFLPPLVSNPVYSGIFDPACEPVVEIIDTESDVVIASYSLSSGIGSEMLRVVQEEEHFIVNWHTEEFALDTSVIYRISVSLEDVEIGHADVDTVDTGRELRNVDTDDYIALKDGRTLPIKFRIEVGVIAENVVYVSETNGDDDNPGTQAEPLRSILVAINRVQSQFATGAVHVAEGTYLVNSESGANVVLVEGISILGGFSANDWDVRDPSTYISTIYDNSSTEGSTLTDPNRVFEAGTGITNATVVDGFNIVAGGGGNTAGIFIYGGAAPYIRNNQIDGGNASSYSVGISNWSASPLIENNSIFGGNGGNNSYGVYNGPSATPTIVHNEIYGGNGGSLSYGIKNDESSGVIIDNNIDGGISMGKSFGINNDNSSPDILSNSIYGGSAPQSHAIKNIISSPLIQFNMMNGGSGTVTHGIYNWSNSAPEISNNIIDGGIGSYESHGIGNYEYSDSTIRNNIISGGSGSTYTFGIRITNSSPVIQNNTNGGGTGVEASWSIYIWYNSFPIIENNILFATVEAGSLGFCVFEQDTTVHPLSVRSNDFFDCPSALYKDAEFGSLMSIGTMEDRFELRGIPTGGNLSINPEFANLEGSDADRGIIEDNDWHLTDASPLLVKTGGVDLSAFFDVDLDELLRTVPWSIGAFEKD